MTLDTSWPTSAIVPILIRLSHSLKSAVFFLQSDWQKLFSAEGAVGALTKTTAHTKNLLSNLGEMKWIDKTVSLISGRSTDSDTGGDPSFVVQGCHPFYEDIIARCQPSIVSAFSY